MSLKWIPENEKVYFLKMAETDAWGISKSAESKIEYKGTVKSAEESTPLDSIAGKQVIPTYKISINGAVPFTVGDYVEVEGRTMIVLNKKETKDLSGKVLFSRFTA